MRAHYVGRRDQWRLWPEWVAHYQRVIDLLDSGERVPSLPAAVVREFLPGGASGYWDLLPDDELVPAGIARC